MPKDNRHQITCYYGQNGLIPPCACHVAARSHSLEFSRSLFFFHSASEPKRWWGISALRRVSPLIPCCYCHCHDDRPAIPSVTGIHEAMMSGANGKEDVCVCSLFPISLNKPRDGWSFICNRIQTTLLKNCKFPPIHFKMPLPFWKMRLKYQMFETGARLTDWFGFGTSRSRKYASAVNSGVTDSALNSVITAHTLNGGVYTSHWGRAKALEPLWGCSLV